MNNYIVKGRIWINHNDQPLLGAGKLELLLKVKELGSLRQAAAEMKMSYRKAWYSINQINKLSQQPVVVLKRGGKDGGKAVVTEYGNKLLATFEQLQQEFAEFMKEQTKKIDM